MWKMGKNTCSLFLASSVQHLQKKYFLSIHFDAYIVNFIEYGMCMAAHNPALPGTQVCVCVRAKDMDTAEKNYTLQAVFVHFLNSKMDSNLSFDFLLCTYNRHATLHTTACRCCLYMFR